MYTMPDWESTAIPYGWFSKPLPEPKELAEPPHAIINPPVLLNSSIRLLSVSATYTLPEEELTAIPVGLLNCPSPRVVRRALHPCLVSNSQCVPHDVMGSPLYARIFSYYFRSSSRSPAIASVTPPSQRLDFYKPTCFTFR